MLHAIAARPPPTSIPAREISNAITGSMLRGLAMAGQFVVPILCIGAAVVSFVGQRRRRRLLLHVTEGGSPAAAIDAMSWQDFELLVGEAFRLQGFQVIEKGGASSDGGVDLKLMKGGDRYLVQAKHWRARQVPVEVVRELAGVMPFRRAAGAFVVTSGRFTEPAAQFAEGRGIELISGRKLAGMLVQARASLETRGTAKPASSSVEEATSQTRSDASAPASAAAPSCPACGASMKLRIASKGPNAGGRFWGCSTFPSCRGTRS